ncbi:hypothetical protein [Hyphomonas sp.]|uniref:hypothetical protein n=1 Tax=Hyphomonas sp. TaxID=87 RepID=UPI00333F63DF
MPETPDPVVPQLEGEAIRARNRRNLWLGLALAGFVLLVMVMTFIRLNTAAGISDRM